MHFYKATDSPFHKGTSSLDYTGIQHIKYIVIYFIIS